MIKNPPLASLAAALLLGLGSAQATLVQSFVSNTAPGSTPGADMTYAADASSSDLLQGLTGTYVGWQLTGTFNPANLNDGSYGTTSIGDTPNSVAFAADTGTSATYMLGSGNSGLGYTVSSVVSLASWRDSSLLQQHYEIWTRLNGASDFQLLYTVANNLDPIGNLDFGGSSKVTVTDSASGPVATGIDAIRFVILDIPSTFEPSPGGGSTTFREIDVFGASTVPEPSSAALLFGAALTAFSLRRRTPVHRHLL
jgi:hypothetical protein